GTSERITHTTHQAPRTEHGHQAPTRRRPVDYGPAAPGDGQSTRPDGHITRTLGNPVDMPAAVRAFVPPHLCATPPPLPGRARALCRARVRPLRAAGPRTPPSTRAPPVRSHVRSGRSRRPGPRVCPTRSPPGPSDTPRGPAAHGPPRQRTPHSGPPRGPPRRADRQR